MESKLLQKNVMTGILWKGMVAIKVVKLSLNIIAMKSNKNQYANQIDSKYFLNKFIHFHPIPISSK